MLGRIQKDLGIYVMADVSEVGLLQCSEDGKLKLHLRYFVPYILIVLFDLGNLNVVTGKKYYFIWGAESPTMTTKTRHYKIQQV